MVDRRAVERASGPLLVVLSRQPRLLVPVGSLVLLVAGVLLPEPWGAVPLVALLLFVAWLSYLSWPVVQGAGRAIRVATVAVVAALAVTRLG